MYYRNKKITVIEPAIFTSNGNEYDQFDRGELELTE